ncbi:MAG TPA: hypothetical protein VK395_22320 [Gemmataceae bacterium]|nr:hypothetical protein [Gemmataceae bacterium]
MPDTTATGGATPTVTVSGNNSGFDPQMVFTGAMARLNEIGNLSIQQATENSGRLSAMFGVRAAQSNPVEAASIQTLKAAGQPENAGAGAISSLASVLSMALMNLAHVTPATQTPPTQK